MKYILYILFLSSMTLSQIQTDDKSIKLPKGYVKITEQYQCIVFGDSAIFLKGNGNMVTYTPEEYFSATNIDTLVKSLVTRKVPITKINDEKIKETKDIADAIKKISDSYTSVKGDSTIKK